jgi:uncharacterized protein YraI
MMSRSDWRQVIVPRIVVVLGALVLAVVQTPTVGRAQTCTNCVVAAGVPLNVLQEPSLEAVVLRTVPQGSLLVREAGAEVNRHVPVTYGGVSGWVIGDGIIPAPESVERYATTTGPTAPAVAAQVATSADARVTLAPLMLRSAPSMEAEPMMVMPLGAVVTLTWEGAENGYVTVDYGGVTGWAYADLLGETIGAAQPGIQGVSPVIADSVAPSAVEPAPVSAEPVYAEPVPVAPVYEEPAYDEPVPIATGCDPSYPDLCIPPAPPYLNCDDIGVGNFTVLAPDPHGLDGNGNGVGCE